MHLGSSAKIRKGIYFLNIRIDGTSIEGVAETRSIGIVITSNLMYTSNDEITRTSGNIYCFNLTVNYFLRPPNDGSSPTVLYACSAWLTSPTIGLQCDMERV